MIPPFYTSSSVMENARICQLDKLGTTVCLFRAGMSSGGDVRMSGVLRSSGAILVMDEPLEQGGGQFQMCTNVRASEENNV